MKRRPYRLRRLQRCNPTNEEKIDRRAHWIQLVVTGLVAATVFCVKLQMGMTQLEQDFKDYKKEMKQTIRDYDNRLDDLHDHVLTLEVERRQK